MLVPILSQPMAGTMTILIKMAALATLSLSVAKADTVASASPLTLKQALQRTLQHAPELKRYPYQEREAEALRLQAGLRPSPQLRFSIDNALGTGTRSDFDNAEFTLGLSQLIELGDKRLARIGLSDARWQSDLTAYEVARLELLAETSRRYYRLLLQQDLHLNIAKRLRQENTALHIIEQRQKAGAVAAADAAKMRLRLAQTRLQLRQSQAQIEFDRAQLAGLWLQQANFSQAEGNLLKLPPAADFSALMLAIDKSPSYRQKAVENELAKASLRQQQALSRADLTLGFGIRHLEQNNDQALVFDVSMPLAIDNPNRGNLNAAYSRQSWSETELAITHQRISLELQNFSQRIGSLRQQAHLLQADLIPKAETLLLEVERGYQQGLYSVLQWVDAQSELFQLRAQQTDLHYSIFVQRLELERISGQPLANKTNATQTIDAPKPEEN